MSSLWRQFSDLEFQLRLSVPIAMIALQCLVAIWAATSKTHWFWRALAVWAAIMLLIPIKAWEPAWMFGLSSPLIIGALVASRWTKSRFAVDPTAKEPQRGRDRWRFSLRDLLLVVLFVALWLPGLLEIGRQFQPRNWLGWLVSSVSLAALSVAAYACARAPRRWLDVGLLALALLEIAVAVFVNALLDIPLAVGLGIAACVAVAACAALLAYGCAFDWRHWLALLAIVFVVPASAAAVCLAGPWMKHLDPASVATGMPGMKVARLGIVELEIVAFLVVIIALGRYVQGSDASFRRRIGFGSLLAIVVCVSCVWLSFYYVNLLRATTPALRITKYPTSHNNVDRIVVLADIALAINRRLGNWDHKSIAELRLAAPSSKEPQQLQALYRQLLPLLDAPNALVYEPSTEANVKYLPGSVGELGWLFHSLARGLRAELDSAIAGNRFNDETDYALALVRLGDMVGRGGIESDAQLGTQIRGEGYQQLARLRSDLPSERLREAIETLRRSLAEREDPAAARTRQLDYEERNFGWGLRLQQILRRLTRNFDDEARQLNPRWAADADQQSLLVNLVLQADLAVRLFHHQQGRLPRNLDELAPNYLPSIPLDPYSHPLRLKVENGQFIVYSIGWDGIDNGGKFSHWWDYATGEWRAHVDRGTWKTTELAPGGEREYYGQPGIDFDLETLTRSFE